MHFWNSLLSLDLHDLRCRGVLTLQPRLQLLEQRWGRNATKTSRHQSAADAAGGLAI